MYQEKINASKYFSLDFKQTSKKTAITMQFSLPFATTRNLPGTKTFLQEFAPTVLNTECFNELNLPFDQEVNNTEIGHLFEHLLIDEFCLSQIRSGEKSSVVNGRTFWNWQKDPFGTFEIWIDIGKDKLSVFLEALKKTIQLIENLIQTSFTISQLALNPSSAGNQSNLAIARSN